MLYYRFPSKTSILFDRVLSNSKLLHQFKKIDALALTSFSYCLESFALLLPLVALRTFARRISCFTFLFWFAPFLVGWRVPELSRDVYQKYTQKYTRKYTQKYTPRVQYNTKGGPETFGITPALLVFGCICLYLLACVCVCL